jgi:Superinfection immunity protein
MLFLLGVFLLVCYFVPAFVAVSRSHRNTASIVILNIFLGWTFIGWLVALVWSFTNDPQTS